MHADPPLTRSGKPRPGPFDLVRRGFAERGLNVTNLTDDDLIHVAQDAVAEFGDRDPTDVEYASIIWRYQPGRKREQRATPHRPRLDYRAVLDFEDQDHGYSKDRAIRETFDVRPGAYQLALNRALEDPAAERYKPALVTRLRRERDRRRMLRTAQIGASA